MANDLSNLDENEPAASDPVSSGDDEIRKTRLHVKNWAGIEHALTGPHKFPYGDQSAKPAAGNAGRIFFDTSLERGEIDNGSQWNQLHCAQLRSAFSAGEATLTVTNSYSIIQSLPVSMANYATVFVIGRCIVRAETSGVWNIDLRIVVNGDTIQGETAHVYHTSFDYKKSIEVFGAYYALISGGSIWVSLEMKKDLADDLFLGYRGLWVLVV